MQRQLGALKERSSSGPRAPERTSTWETCCLRSSGFPLLRQLSTQPSRQADAVSGAA